MSNTFTEQDMQNYADYVAKAALSNITPNLDRWYAEWHKPTKKVIDSSVLVDSQIDCEFSDSANFHLVMKRSLIEVRETGTGRFRCELRTLWKHCRPRMNHIHTWQGGECPLPEGFRVKVWWRNGGGDVGDAFNLRWSDEQRGSDIIAFEVLGVADGYVMPWEQDNA